MLEAATSKRDTLQLEKELADSKFREAKMFTKLCGMKAKQAERDLQVADIYISRIHWVISKGDHRDVLPPENVAPRLAHMAVRSDGSKSPFKL